MSSQHHLAPPGRVQHEQLSTHGLGSSVGSHPVAFNSSALRVPGRDTARSRPRNSDLETNIELDTVHRKGLSARSSSSQHSARDNVHLGEDVGVIAGGFSNIQNDDEEEEEEEDDEDGASIRTQRTRLERRDLSMFDVAALIINKMAGTGIFTTPGLVLGLTANKKLITLLAILVLTVVCFLHYFSRNSGLLLNLLFSAYKICLIVVFIIAGGVAYGTSTDRPNDWNDQPVGKKDALAALIYIIYSYQGWENANYVGGELRVARSDLKWGAFMAVGIVTTLYTLVTMAYSLACPFADLVDQDLGIVAHFVPNAFGGSNGWAKVCIALSAFGNLVAVVYTSSKVKQQIARQCLIPFFKFFGKEDKQFETPMGALLLHWIFAAIWIINTPNTSDGYGFVIGIFIYGQLIVGVCMGVAFFFIRRTYEGRGSRKTPENVESKIWSPVILKSDWFGYPAALLFIAMNLMILVESAKADGAPHRWIWPIIIFGLFGVASIYWAMIRITARVSNNRSPLEIRIVKNVRGGNTGTPEDQPALKQAKLEGKNRIVVYKLHGKAARFRAWIDVWGHKMYKLIAR